MQANGHDDPVQAMAELPLAELIPDLRGRRAVVTGAARGIGEADLLRRVLDLAGVPGDGLPANLAAADPR